jgi:hypothetical protein
MKRPIIALAPPRRMHDFLMYAKAIAARVAEDPLFQPPPPSLTVLDADLAALEAVLVAGHDRGKGRKAERRAAEAKVQGGLDQLVAFVQSIANGLPPPEAAVVIERSGMNVKDARGPSKGAMVVKRGRTPDAAHVYAKAAKTRASYEWQRSDDGERWVSFAITHQADAATDGLVAGTLYWFRLRTSTKDGVSDWTEPVAYRAG